jgi:hypothetical protein
MAKVVPGTWTFTKSVPPSGEKVAPGELLVAHPIVGQRERLAMGRDPRQELVGVVAVGAT